MKKSKQWEAAFLWFPGVIATSLTALVGIVFVVFVVSGVSPEILRPTIRLWVNFSVVIAAVPALLVLVDVASDQCMQKCAEMGKGMLLWGNPAGWLYLIRRKLVSSPTFWLVVSIIVPTRYPKVPDARRKGD